MRLNTIYLLFSCDAWKTKDYMRLLMATTILETVTGVICEKLRQGDMEYRGLTGDAAVEAYTTEPNAHDLKYGYLESVGDGECL